MHEFWQLTRQSMLHYAGITRQGLIRYGQSSGKILSVYGCLLLEKAEAIRKQALAGIRAATPIVRDRLYHYALLIRLNKPTGIYLLLWPTLWALWIAAAGIPDMHILVVFVLGVFLMRSGGCILNDLADMRFDGEVERTRTRRIVAGFVTPREALFVAEYETTVTADGAFWSPFAPTVVDDRVDTDLLISRTVDPLRVPALF